MVKQNSMKITARILGMHPLTHVGQNNTPKLTVRVETVEQYPQIYEVDFLGDKSDIPQSYSPGEIVEIKANLNGRMWTNNQGKDINILSVSGWGMQRQGQSQQAQQPMQGQPQQRQGFPQQGTPQPQNFNQPQNGQFNQQQPQQGNPNPNNYSNTQFNR